MIDGIECRGENLSMVVRVYLPSDFPEWTVENNAHHSEMVIEFTNQKIGAKLAFDVPDGGEDERGTYAEVVLEGSLSEMTRLCGQLSA